MRPAIQVMRTRKGTRGDEETKSRTRQTEQKAFGKKLAKDLPVGCAQSKAHGEFAHPACGPHQQQAGDVDHGHRHDQHHHTHHDEERRTKIVAVGREALRA